MISKAGLKDARVLCELGAETFIGSHVASAPGHEIARYVKEKYSLSFITTELSNPANIYHIIEHENEIAGFSKIMFNSDHPVVNRKNVTKLDQIYLLNSFQGLKLGAKLLQYNIELAKANKQTGMWLVVWVGNLHSISIYEKFGFKTITDADFHLTDTHTSRCHIMLLNF